MRLGRVSNLPTVWTNCLAGIILAGAAPDAILLGCLAASISLFYVSGMFLNDAFDHHYDRDLRPERPIPSGAISLGEVYAVGFGLMAAGEGLLAVAGIWNRGRIDLPVIVAGGVLGALIIYYNYRHKRDPLSPLVMASCRGMIYLIAGAVIGSALSPAVLAGASVLMAYLVGLTYVAKQENLREVRNLWPLAFLLVPFAYSARLLTGWDFGALLYVAFLVWVVYAVSFVTRKTGRNIPRAVVSLIAGISLLDGVLIATVAGPSVWVLLALAGFGLTLFFQRFVPGT